MSAGPQDAQKLYQQIARTIAASIEDGRYAPGDRLPSEREFAEDFGVSRPTIRDAMIGLEFQGLVEARQGSGVFTHDLGAGRASYWEPTDPVKGTMAIALMVDPRSLVEIRQDAENYLVLVKVEPGKPFVFYMGAAWDKGLDFHDRTSWEAYVREQTPDFDPARK